MVLHKNVQSPHKNLFGAINIMQLNMFMHETVQSNFNYKNKLDHFFFKYKINPLFGF